MFSDLWSSVLEEMEMWEVKDSVLSLSTLQREHGSANISKMPLFNSQKLSPVIENAPPFSAEVRLVRKPL